jgi:hypothetical protein
MSQSFLQFSEVLEIHSDEEEQWLRTRLEEVYITDDKQIVAVAEEGSIPPDKVYKLAPRFLAEAIVAEEDVDESIGFEWEFETSAAGGRVLWIHADDNGTPAHAAFLVQDFLKRFDPAGWWSFTWAATSSKPACGEFFGGAVAVTATEIRGADTHDWLNQLQSELTLVKERRR